VEAVSADLTRDLQEQEVLLEEQRQRQGELLSAHAARHQKGEDMHEAQVNSLRELSESLTCAAGRAAEQVGAALALASQEHHELLSSHRTEVEELEGRLRMARAAVRQGEQDLLLQVQQSKRDRMRLGEALGQLEHLALSHQEQSGAGWLSSVALVPWPLNVHVESPSEQS
jgi:hypothetical protein